MSGLPYQWSVFVVDLDPAVGSEQVGRRPVLVVSREVANAALPVVTALPLTTLREGRRIYPNEVVLPAGTAGLDRDSVVMAHQIRTLSKQRLGALLGRIDDPLLRTAVRAALHVQLDLNS
ncbi:MAG: type II toxin-antitoxin system PemK/MazF family toxin [Holophagae bacterium]|nr:MAG: type II toxin-antitoxin system PemK/MazF family toxin [Holophagae bacterium]